MRTPPIGGLLNILIGQHGLKRPSMQIEIKDISSSKCATRDRCEKLLVDGPVACDSDGGWGVRSFIRVSAI
jgi:hypothetical protein